MRFEILIIALTFILSFLLNLITSETIKLKNHNSFKSQQVLNFIKTTDTTTPSNDGQGGVLHLDRHAINCGSNAAINYIKLNTVGGMKSYNYKCIRTNSISNNCINKQTSPTDGSKSFTDNIEKHSIDCNSGTVLRSFALERDSSSIYFRYSCCHAKVHNSFDVDTEQPKDGDQKNVVDGQEVDAKDLNVISKLKFSTTGNNNYYAFTANHLAV